LTENNSLKNLGLIEMEGCSYFGKWRECSECEHYDGSSCMSGEKLTAEAEYRGAE